MADFSKQVLLMMTFWWTFIAASNIFTTLAEHVRDVAALSESKQEPK